MDFIVFDCCASYTVFLASRTKRAICCRKHNNCTPLTMGQKILSMLVEKSPKFVLLISAFEFHFPFKMEIVALILEKKILYAFECSRKKYFFPSVNETFESYTCSGGLNSGCCLRLEKKWGGGKHFFFPKLRQFRN